VKADLEERARQATHNHGRAGRPRFAAAPVTGDRRILGLFREWATALRQAEATSEMASEEDFDEAVGGTIRIEEALAETPAESLAGLAFKVFLLCRHDYGRVSRDKLGADPCTLWAIEDGRGISSLLALSAIRDIARLVPELAALCAPTLAEEAQP
jgi:hypothetical protein